MLDPSDFRDLVSGRRRGLGATLARFGLRLAETPYAAAVQWRNRRYDTGRVPVHRVEVPVVSVGNLTLGGTGKTPMVEWIARWYRRHGVRVAIVSRGYGAESGAKNDEAAELEQRLADVPHLQNPDRVEAARTAIDELGSRLIVLDDAFQHRRIHRDLDLVMLDALEPFGFGHVFPRGMLREPLGGLRRAQVVILSRADAVEQSAREAIRREVVRHAPEALWAEVAQIPRALFSAEESQRPTAELAGKPVAAFCGIGNPDGFRHTLDACAYRVAAFREFPDHYRYARGDVESLSRWAATLDVSAVVCTHKDLVKLRTTHLGGKPVWALVIGLDFLGGREGLEKRLAELLPEQPAEIEASPDAES